MAFVPRAGCRLREVPDFLFRVILMKRSSLASGPVIVTALLAGSLLAQGPRRGGPPGGGGGAGLPVLAALDTDGDGELSSKEIDNATASLRTLDKNKDGKLSREELLPAPRGGGPAGPSFRELVERLMAFDKNGDGKLSRDELPERIRGLLDRADANKDGLVDKDELTRHAQQQAGRRTGPDAGRGGFPNGEGRRRPDESRGQDSDDRPRS